MAKYIFVMGGVCSSLGKGIAAASIGLLLKRSGILIKPMKIDPYLNVDPGTMNPERHGEVFVLEDGSETDLDLGHYERFLNQTLTKDSTLTMGQVYKKVLDGEREGIFLGKDIQIVPHVTDIIKSSILEAGKNTDVVIVELGGTVGDIEGLPVVEAVRQLRHELPKRDTLVVMLTLLPYLKSNNELKTKPTQMAIGALQRMGIFSDMILTRSDFQIKKDHLEKIALFCNVDLDAVFPAYTLPSIYEVPSAFAKLGMHKKIMEKLKIEIGTEPDIADFENICSTIQNENTPRIMIAEVTKYNEMDDAYISVHEAIKAACYNQGCIPEIIQVQAEKLEKNDEEEWTKLRLAHGIVVPGGFGSRGIEGKILAAKYARENNVPYLGLCLGSQIMAVEFARNVCGLTDAHSTEFDENTQNPVVHIMESQKSVYNKGGTMRKGGYPCALLPGSLAHRLYGKEHITERHRHRYEFNNDYRELLQSHGLTISGSYVEEDIAEIVEIAGHPFMIGSQFHPEFTSRPTDANPLFVGLVEAANVYRFASQLNYERVADAR